ncbi:MAG TPA: MBL fold metallo-hydrolase [Anaerolineales bacterium]|nr:MBL fold metallo-hydrolase [Anaerolineales bacterium]
MKVVFHGAAQTVTGSRHLVHVNGHQLLLDCGFFQGRRKDTHERNLKFTFDPQQVDAVVLSHAHMDHCGNTPTLVRQGFTGRIHAHPATADLTEYMLLDSAHIQEADADFLNRRRQPEIDQPVVPLYTVADARRTLDRLVAQPYEQTFEPVPGARVRLVDAGHILGSAGIIVDLEEKGRTTRLMFSGDIGRRDLPLLRDPVLPVDVDVLIMECTYGDRVHGSPAGAYEALQAVIRRTAERGGKVIIPSFAVGRAQTLVYYLHQMQDRGELPLLPVYVDSPLAIDITSVFRAHAESFDQETQAFVRADPHGTAFGFDRLTYTRSVEASKAINAQRGPLIVISASGMAESGRILHHLRNNIGDPRNTVLITSWMAPDTLGRRLAEGEKVVRIFGEPHDVRAEVATIDGLSGHAGQDQLLDYARSLRGRVRRICLVHGEPGPAAALTEKLRDAGLSQVSYPRHGEEAEL